jgi:exodeoxyribonuclease VII large subunit
VLKRRFPNVNLLIFPVRVQGEGAAAEIAEAIRQFNLLGGLDVMIVARGGGSLEDLWAFNEEAVARAIAASGIPVITGVGHETDFTIADFVADLRAPTPSAAAEIVVRQRNDFENHIAQQSRRLADGMRYRVSLLLRRIHQLRGSRAFQRPQDLLRRRGQQLDELSGWLAEAVRTQIRLRQRGLASPQARLQAFSIRRRAETLRLRIASLAGSIFAALNHAVAQRQRALTTQQMRLASLDLRVHVIRLRRHLDAARASLQVCVERGLSERRRKFEALGVQLQERSPFGLLERGYAIARDADGRILRSPDQVAEGDAISLRLARRSGRQRAADAKGAFLEN